VGVFNPGGQTVHTYQFFAYLPGNIGQVRERCHHANWLRERQTGLKPKQADRNKQGFPMRVSQ
jgi:hypothetical protein